MRYMVVIEKGEKGEKGYGAHVPDLPGCIAAGETREEVINLIEEAIDLILKIYGKTANRYLNHLPLVSL